MPFRIAALPAEPFEPLFAMSDEDLAARGAVRRVVDAPRGFPCRVSLADAPVGANVLLLNHEHQSAATPFRACHAIFVAEAARQAFPEADTIPDILRRRLLSVRAFDAQGMMVAADVVPGEAADPLIERMLAPPDVAYLHLHNAKRGCYFARADRA